MMVGAPTRDERRRRQVERADVVQRAAGQPEVGRREPELGDVGQVLPRQVGVGDHDALGPTGRPRRVHQPVDVVGVVRGRAAARTGLELGEAAPTARAGSARADTHQRGLHVRSRGPGQVAECVVADQCPRRGVLQDVTHLRGRQPPVDRHGNGAEVVRGEHHLEELRTVVGEQPDDVTLAHPSLGQPAGQGDARAPPFRCRS